MEELEQKALEYISEFQKYNRIKNKEDFFRVHNNLTGIEEQIPQKSGACYTCIKRMIRNLEKYFNSK